MLLTDSEKDSVLSTYRILLSRVMKKNFKAFQYIGSIYLTHVPHKYSKEMQKNRLCAHYLWSSKTKRRRKIVWRFLTKQRRCFKNSSRKVSRIFSSVAVWYSFKKLNTSLIFSDQALVLIMSLCQGSIQGSIQVNCPQKTSVLLPECRGCTWNICVLWFFSGWYYRLR